MKVKETQVRLPLMDIRFLLVINQPGDKRFLYDQQVDGQTMANHLSCRHVYWDDPDVTRRWSETNLKKLAATKKMVCRGIYATNSTHINHIIGNICCNTMPDLDVNSDDFWKKLLILIWPSSFTNDPSKVDPIRGIYLADRKFETIQWKSRYAGALFWLLVKAYDRVQSRSPATMIMSPNMKNAVDTYVQSRQSPVCQFISENMVFTGNKRDAINIPEITSRFEEDAYYSQYTLSVLNEIKRCYRRDYRRRNQSKNMAHLKGGFLINYVWKPQDNNDKDDDIKQDNVEDYNRDNNDNSNNNSRHILILVEHLMVDLHLILILVEYHGGSKI